MGTILKGAGVDRREVSVSCISWLFWTAGVALGEFVIDFCCLDYSI